ncbi:protein trichome birefringence-like 19 [Carica papaya]|uniref:protein trichome birefringence-like 19 n=1 Tax=Carica papaya TaxID=3649 RepID=UPI000B8CD1D0|nr:protein trichome birefringence-like 19 [Carica papaya]
MVHVLEFHLGKIKSHNTTTKALLLLFTSVIFSTIAIYFLNTSFLQWPTSFIPGPKCEIFHGKWVPSPQNQPYYYTNQTCHEIFEKQNCIKFGRHDTDFLKWRWKPHRCELPLFDARQFLELLRGKSMAFVGDSVGRNQMQSLLCLLSTVENPIYIDTIDSRHTSRVFRNYSFTVSAFWSPYLVESIETDDYPNNKTKTRLMILHLDKPSSSWRTQIQKFDYVIISATRWFFGPEVYYENDKIIGCHDCQKPNVKDLTMFYGYRKAFETTFKTLLKLENYRGVTVLRTLSPAHFEHGEWNNGGYCNRTSPVLISEMKLEWPDAELYLIQREEFKVAKREGEERGLKFRLLDITDAMVVRPDGHPNHYGHSPEEKVTIADCVHWCLPGPIDSWNQFLLHVVKMEAEEENSVHRKGL